MLWVILTLWQTDISNFFKLVNFSRINKGITIRHLLASAKKKDLRSISNLEVQMHAVIKWFQHWIQIGNCSYLPKKAFNFHQLYWCFHLLVITASSLSLKLSVLVMGWDWTLHLFSHLRNAAKDVVPIIYYFCRMFLLFLTFTLHTPIIFRISDYFELKTWFQNHTNSPSNTIFAKLTQYSLLPLIYL